MIYDGFKAAVAAGVPKEKAGILVDEQFGAAILRDAAKKGYLTACPAEKSGQDEFDFEYGEDFATHIEAFNLLLQGSGALQPGRRSSFESKTIGPPETLVRLPAWQEPQPVMFELLVPAEKAQLDRLNGDKKAYDLEIRPN